MARQKAEGRRRKAEGERPTITVEERYGANKIVNHQPSSINHLEGDDFRNTVDG
jgi:hypothetical protein